MFTEGVTGRRLLVKDGLLKVGVARAFNSIEHESLCASIVRVVFVAVNHEDDVYSTALHVARTHELGPIADVVVNHVLHDSDNLGTPMVVEITLADKLGNVALVHVAPVQSVSGPPFGNSVRTQSLVGGHDRTGNVDSLEFDREEFVDCATLANIGDHEINIAEPGHLDFTGDSWIGGRLARPAIAHNVGQKIN